MYTNHFIRNVLHILAAMCTKYNYVVFCTLLECIFQSEGSGYQSSIRGTVGGFALHSPFSGHSRCPGEPRRSLCSAEAEVGGDTWWPSCTAHGVREEEWTASIWSVCSAGQRQQHDCLESRIQIWGEGMCVPHIIWFTNWLIWLIFTIDDWMVGVNN